MEGGLGWGRLAATGRVAALDEEEDDSWGCAWVAMVVG